MDQEVYKVGRIAGLSGGISRELAIEAGKANRISKAEKKRREGKAYSMRRYPEKHEPNVALEIAKGRNQARLIASKGFAEGLQNVADIAACRGRWADVDADAIIGATKLLGHVLGAFTEKVEVQVTHAIPYRSLLEPERIITSDPVLPEVATGEAIDVARQETPGGVGEESSTLPLGELPNSKSEVTHLESDLQ